MSDPDQEVKRARERAAFQSERDEFGRPLYFESHSDGRLEETFTGPGPSLDWLRHVADQPRPAAPPPAPRLCNRCLANDPLRGMRWCGPCAIRAQEPPDRPETNEEKLCREERLRYLTARAAAAAAGAETAMPADTGEFQLAELIEVYEEAGDLEIPFPE